MEMCRLCLLTLNGSICHEIFDGDSDMVLKIITCLPLQLSKKDNLPSKICKPCFNKVNEFYDFRIKVMETDQKLKKFKDDYGDSQEYVNEEFQSVKDEQSYDELSKSEYKCEIIIHKISIATQTDEISRLTMLSNNDGIKKELENYNEQNELEIEYDPLFKTEPIVEDEKFDYNISDNVSSIDSCDDSENSEYLIPIKRRKVKNQVLKNANKSKKKRNIKTIEKICVTSNSDNTNLNNIIHDSEEKLIKSTSTELGLISGELELDDEKLSNNNDKSGDSSSNEGDICKTSWVCCVCFRKFHEKSEILLHYKLHYRMGYTLIHVDKRKKLYSCTICNEKCSSKQTFHNHAKTHNFKPYKCSLCEKAFISIELIFKHGQNVHANELLLDTSKTNIKDLKPKPSSKRYICDICDETFVYVKYVLSHRKEMHPESKGVKMVYRCLYCNSKFAFENTLRRHLNLHTKDRQYLCNTCGKSFNSEDIFKRHQKIHTGIKPNKCETCGMAFVKRDNLKLHERIHTGERPYVCSHCGKAFARKPTLTVHERQHTGTKPYTCTFCSKGFVVKGQLTTHLKHCKNKKS